MVHSVEKRYQRCHAEHRRSMVGRASALDPSTVLRVTDPLEYYLKPLRALRQMFS